MKPEEIIATINNIASPDWQDNLRRWIAVTATGKNGPVPPDEQIARWLEDPDNLIRVSALVRRIPTSWMKEK